MESKTKTNQKTNRKHTNLIEKRDQWQGWEEKELDKCGQKGRTSSYKITKF